MRCSTHKANRYQRLAMYGHFVCLTALMVVLSRSPVTHAQDAALQVAPLVPKKLQQAGEPNSSRIASHLRQARDENTRGRMLARIARENRFIRAVGDEVEIDVRLNVAPTEQHLTALRHAGFRVQSHIGGLVSGTIRLEALDRLEAVDHVTSIHPNYGCRTMSEGIAFNQADSSLRAALARSTYNVDGTGVNVGILSDSIRDVIGGALSGTCLTGSASQLTGDLPPLVGVLNAGPGGGSDEGAAMAELVHDLAPGSHIAFHSAFNSIADFAQGIIELSAASGCGKGGCQVICDDVIYFAEPMYQDGEIAQAVDTAVAAGAAYFSSAGNGGTKGLEDAFDSANADGRIVHDFTGSNDPFLNVTFGSGGGEVIAVLQWNQPYSGTLGNGSEIDLDLYLTTSTVNWTSSIVGGSDSYQGTAGNPFGDPLEIMSVSSAGASTAYFVIDRYAGTTTNTRVRLVFYTSGSVTFQSGAVNGPTIYGHTAAAGAISTAAAFTREVALFGAYTGGPEINVESFSSRGGYLPFFFNSSGNPLPGTPITRFKPDLTSVDGTNTSFFGSPDVDNPADGFPNFFGTSAAAPHLAAIAALMLDRASDAAQSVPPTELYALLRGVAADIETPGRDSASGDGLVYADTAVGAVCGGITIQHQPLGGQVCEGATFMFCTFASGAGTVDYQWTLNSQPIPGANSPCFEIASVNLTDAGDYRCILEDSCDVRDSAIATLTVNPRAAPDLDGDCDVDAADQTLFNGCATGPAGGPPTLPCELADLDLDGDIDQSDYGLFQRCLSGAGSIADPACIGS